MKQKDADIVITTYNRPHELMKIIEILSKQVNMNFNLIINDDGGAKRIDPSVSPIITKYIFNVDDGYHRVVRFNESVSLCVSPNIIMIDDDCAPVSKNFVQSHIDILKNYELSKGIVRFPNGQTTEHDERFCTANLGIKLNTVKENGLYDDCYDGYYGFEDLDLNFEYKKRNIKIGNGTQDTIVDHGAEIYANGDRSNHVLGHNRKEFVRKWGYDPTEGQPEQWGGIFEY
ncbi:hypothetical protein CMI37_24350 [Candidatus Pacearchaeota archaeon]|nr:hypothetical protein [Candidatus Pacearchaeota archaeon]